MILDEILERTREDLKRRKVDFPEEWLGRSLAYNPYLPRPVIPRLRCDSSGACRIIAEVKKASPSKGVIREDFDPLALACAYQEGGAAALSILTEPHFFQGNLEYLTQVRRYTSLPLLRKDFIIDSYQILEALVYGADFILLIAAALSRRELRDLLTYARRLGLEVLVEIHSKEDLTKAIFAGADIIGINHRNLQTFEMQMNLCSELIPLIPQGKVIIAESGISSKETLQTLQHLGVDAFLIGEYFMRQKSVKEAIEEFLL